MDLVKIRNDIIYSLHNYMDLPIVPQDSEAKSPEYPFLAYKFIVPYNPQEDRGVLTKELVPSNSENFDFDIKETLILQPTMTLSINAYVKKELDKHMGAYGYALKALNWFNFMGYEDLKTLNVIVVDTSAIRDRTVLMTDEYEARAGFDVVLRIAEAISRRTETIEEIDISRSMNS